MLPMRVPHVATILDRVTDGFLAVDCEWHIVNLHWGAQAAGQASLDREARELRGAVLWDAVPQLRDTSFQDQSRRAMAEQRPVRFQDVVGDTARWIEVHVYPSPEGVTIYFQDITERKRAEDALRLLAEISTIFGTPLDYRERLAQLAHLVVPTLADWCIVDVMEDRKVNRLHVVHADSAKAGLAAAIRHLTQDVDEPGSPVAEVLRTGTPMLLPEVSPRVLRAIASPERVRLAEELGTRSTMIVPLIARQRTLGTLTFLAAESRRRYTPDDLRLAEKLSSHAALAVDNARLYEEAQTARTEAERQRTELERVMKSRALLMRGISHDVKNPLGAADGYAHLLEQGVLGTLSSKQQEGVRRIRRSLQAALRLIYDLLEVARTEPGQIDVHIKPIDVRQVVHDVVEEYLASAKTAGLFLRAETPEDLPAVRSDPDRVRQVLGNLVSNSVKYTPAGGHVIVRAVADTERQPPGPGQWARIEVADTGPGIPTDMQKRIFDEFTRIGSSDVPGTGIGLAISRRIAWALGANITLESKVGHGSTFTLWLPLNGH